MSVEIINKAINKRTQLLYDSSIYDAYHDLDLGKLPIEFRSLNILCGLRNISCEENIILINTTKFLGLLFVVDTRGYIIDILTASNRLSEKASKLFQLPFDHESRVREMLCEFTNPPRAVSILLNEFSNDIGSDVAEWLIFNQHLVYKPK